MKRRALQRLEGEATMEDGGGVPGQGEEGSLAWARREEWRSEVEVGFDDSLSGDESSGTATRGHGRREAAAARPEEEMEVMAVL